ncbi:2-C-methyl-D-erythritol 4-phosphate cytidylyltransferase [bacterium]|nr:2-C-methyl-D-erythritol 4-phosphate cytidylyltransferase [bacterium]
MRAGLLLLAAGEGKRFGSAALKILQPLSGSNVLQLALAPFLDIPTITDIVITAPKSSIKAVQAAVKKSAKARVIAGGETRQQSARLALDALPQEIDFVFVHDAARPCVSRALIENVLSAAVEAGAAIAALPSIETIKRVREGFVEATLRRDMLYTVQTPQAFRRTLFEEAHKLAEAQGIQATDDAALIEQFQLSRVAVVKGSRRNLKITHPYDLSLAEFYLSNPELNEE